MSKKAQLRETRAGTVINKTSKKQESQILQALEAVVAALQQKYSLRLVFQTQWYLSDIVESLRCSFPDIDFINHFKKSSLRPDGGILFLQDSNNNLFPILIGEVKNQGTNDQRAREGKSKQAKGNAIERLGKNVIGLRAALLRESIFPFVCFGYGCDFADDSSILDRVVTIAMFGTLNTTHLHREGPSGEFNRGSFYFRQDPWSVEEMTSIMQDIAHRSILYYFSKYGDTRFQS